MKNVLLTFFVTYSVFMSVIAYEFLSGGVERNHPDYVSELTHR